MSKLKAFIKVLDSLDFPASDIDDCILDNFNKDNESKYIVNDVEYLILSYNELLDMLYDQYENEASEFIDEITYSDIPYNDYAKYLEASILANTKLSSTNLDPGDLNYYSFLGNEDNFYIFELL